jgi:hypothetical protein
MPLNPGYGSLVSKPPECGVSEVASSHMLDCLGVAKRGAFHSH